mgnify:CR=1 FL=1
MSSYVDDERSVREDEHREIIARWYRELDRIEKRVKEIEAKELMKELMKEWEEHKAYVARIENVAFDIEKAKELMKEWEEKYLKKADEQKKE